MLQRAAAIQGKSLPNLSVPLLSPRLSSRWLALVTDVDTATGRNLVDSMTTEMVVHDRSIEQVVPGPCIGYDEAVRLALADRALPPCGARCGPPWSTRSPGTTGSRTRTSPGAGSWWR
jgi:hypothetical protein